MEFDSRYDVIIRLLEKTREHKIDWEIGPLSESYYCRIGENSVAIRKVREDYSLILYNPDGEQVEEIYDPEFANAGFSDAFSIMDKLFISARRNALGTDKIVSNILSELNNK